MILTRRNGLLVEVTDPDTTLGVQHCWISDKRQGSATLDQILAHATGGTVAEAVEKATDILQAKLATA
jgi:hypothetical protein